MKRFTSKTLSAVTLILILSATNGAQAETTSPVELPESSRDYPLHDVGVTLEQALRIFAKTLRIKLVVDEDIALDRVVNMSKGLTRIEYLEELAAEHDLIWYYDGLVLRISHVQSLETSVVPTGEESAEQVLHALEKLGLLQDKFLHMVHVRNGVLRVSGPKSYVESVTSTVETIIGTSRTPPKVLRGASPDISVGVQIPTMDSEGL